MIRRRGHNLVLAAVLGVAACSTNPESVLVRGYDPPVAEGIRELRAATGLFSTVDSAVAVGYTRDVKDCLVHEHHGAMGYHHTNPGLMDGKVEIARPEILLYELLDNGAYRLNGVEFIVPYRTWPRDSIPPRVMGEPMRQEDNLKFWYLHVWSWTRNPEGLFANFHPDVRCSASSRKVFTPSGDHSRYEQDV